MHQSWVMTVEQFKAAASKLDAGQRVSLHGTVTTLVGQGALFLQDATAGVLVYRVNVASHVKVGDVVDANGLPGVAGVMPSMRATGVKIWEETNTVPSLDLNGSRAPGLTFHGMKVRFRSRVSEANAAQPESQAVLLDAFGGTISVVCGAPPDDGSRWPVLAPGDLVEVTGVLAMEEAPGTASVPGWRVIVPSRSDLVWQQTAPWWMRYRPWLISAGIALGAGLFAGVLSRYRPGRVPLRTVPGLRKPSTVIFPQSSLETRHTPFPLSDPTTRDIETRYQELFENATDVILTHDLDGLITTFNPAGERLLGWPASQVVGMPIYRILAPEESDIAGGLVKGGRSEAAGTGSFHLEFQTSDGRTVPFEVNSWIEYQDGEPVGVQAICRDISQRLRTEDERQRFERRLQETQKLESLGILAGGIAHDFNNLLTAILGNASLARLELPQESPTHKGLEEIEMAAERAADLCSQMLAYSGQGRFVVSRVNLSTLVFDTLELIQASVSKRAKLDMNLAEKLPPVHGDLTQLRQVLVNLVTNASEALGDGHGTVAIRTRVMEAEPKWVHEAQLVPEVFEGEYVMLEVTDTGCGMNPETAARIFEPFFTTKFTGRGLGLPAVLGIVRSHRGGLKVESYLGQGTTVWIALPALGMPEAHQPGAKAGDAESRPLFQGTILVVDDEASVRRTITRVLETMGCKVVAAEDGTVALERVRQYGRRFDLVMLDLTMPRMDGVQTLRELRRVRPDVPVILMSGFAQVQAMARFNEHRLSGFLQKPFKLEELTSLVGRVLTEQQGLLNLRV